MTKLDFEKALKALKEINNLTVKRHLQKKGKNTIRIDYKNEKITLNKYTLIFSGTLEQTFTKDHSTDKLYLAIALLDSYNNDLTFKPNQLNEMKNELTHKILA